MTNRNYSKIDCSDVFFSSLVNEYKNPDNPWSETNLYSNIALAKFLDINLNSIDITRPPHNIRIKSTSSDTLYPEIKERDVSRPFEYYILSVFNTKTREVFLEGWVDYKTLTQDKNLYRGYYVVSFQDLLPMENFKNVFNNC